MMYQSSGEADFFGQAGSGPAAGDDEEGSAAFRANDDTKVCGGEIGCAKQNAGVGIEGNASVEDPGKDLHGLDIVNIRPQVLLHD
jgi:hypothetical protein